MSISMTQSQVSEFTNFVESGDYPGAYNYLAEIVNNTPDGDPRVANWLETAAHINADDGSFYSEFVRAATQEAGEDMNRPISDVRFQEVSNDLALDIFTDVSKNNEIPDIDTIIEKDVSTAVEDLRLNPEGWAGTLFGTAPTQIGGLDLDADSQFYEDLWRSLDERGVDKLGEQLGVFVDVLENNLVGLGAGALAAVDALLSDIWQGIEEGYFNARNSLADFLTEWDPLNLMPEAVNEHWTEARDWQPPRDPLAIDLDQDGKIETVGIEGEVLFDHNGDGNKTGTGWLSSDDAWLALDRNLNGAIDDGGELFGEHTLKSNGEFATDGFDALADLDTNNDNVIDANDARYHHLRVWRDENQDGISQRWELNSLASSGIESISLGIASQDTTKRLPGGNRQGATSTYTDGLLVNRLRDCGGSNLAHLRASFR